MKKPDFYALVDQALARIPRIFREAMANVEIIVDDYPDPDLMEEVTGNGDAVLYGLFSGRPITERSFGDWGEPPAVIHLYRKPLEEDFPDPENLSREIEVTLVHEIAHFMGFDEDTLAEYGYE